MGLDNGIEVKRTEFTNSLPWLRSLEGSWDKEHKYDFEVCYWRKCWNVRRIVLDICEEDSPNDFEFELTLDQLVQIRDTLKQFNAKNWDNSYGNSIWTWKEHKRSNRRHITRLNKLIKLKKKYGDLIEVYFYDSY